MYYQTHIILSINYSTSGKLKPSKLYIAIHHWSWQRISISPKSVKHTLLCATTKHSTKHPSFRSFGFSKCADRFSFAASRIIVHVVCATTNKLQKKKKRRIVSNVAMDAVDLWKEKKKERKKEKTNHFGSKFIRTRFEMLPRVERKVHGYHRWILHLRFDGNTYKGQSRKIDLDFEFQDQKFLFFFLCIIFYSLRK